MKNKNRISRRHFVKASVAGSIGAFAFTNINCGRLNVSKPMTRTFGRLGFKVTTLGLRGQASIQWTPDDVKGFTNILANPLKIYYTVNKSEL